MSNPMIGPTGIPSYGPTGKPALCAGGVPCLADVNRFPGPTTCVTPIPNSVTLTIPNWINNGVSSPTIYTVYWPNLAPFMANSISLPLISNATSECIYEVIDTINIPYSDQQIADILVGQPIMDLQQCAPNEAFKADWLYLQAAVMQWEVTYRFVFDPEVNPPGTMTLEISMRVARPQALNLPSFGQGPSGAGCLGDIFDAGLGLGAGDGYFSTDDQDSFSVPSTYLWTGCSLEFTAVSLGLEVGISGNSVGWSVGGNAASPFCNATDQGQGCASPFRGNVGDNPYGTTEAEAKVLSVSW